MNTLSHPPTSIAAPPLCDARGRLNSAAVGWSSRPQTLCQLSGNAGRRKRWNHWCINAPGWMLSITIADLDYLGYGAVYFLDLETGQSVHRTQFSPFGLGCHLPDMPNQSTVSRMASSAWASTSSRASCASPPARRTWGASR